MIDDLQKASVLKRISAYLFDLILLCVLIVGVASLLSLALGYNDRLTELNGYYETYGKEYGVDLQISSAEYAALSASEQSVYTEAFNALNGNTDAVKCYNLVMNLTLVIVILAVFVGYLILEFFVPMWLKNGQTLGKKIFALALMRSDSVRVNNVQLFVRAILGKFTVETMVPIFIIIMIFFNSIGIVGVIVLGGILILQIAMIIATQTNSAIHDRLADTVVVDMPSQMIFESTEEMLEFKKQRHKEMADRRAY